MPAHHRATLNKVSRLNQHSSDSCLPRRLTRPSRALTGRRSHGSRPMRLRAAAFVTVGSRVRPDWWVELRRAAVGASAARRTLSAAAGVGQPEPGAAGRRHSAVESRRGLGRSARMEAGLRMSAGLLVTENGRHAGGALQEATFRLEDEYRGQGGSRSGWWEEKGRGEVWGNGRIDAHELLMTIISDAQSITQSTHTTAHYDTPACVG